MQDLLVCGGKVVTPWGGYGDPRERDRRLVEADLKNGYVTPDAARRDFGDEGGREWP